MLTGTFSFDEQVDVAVLPEHIAACLSRVHAREIQINSNCISFSGGLFRLVSNWNVLVQFERGELTINPHDRRLHYRLGVRQLILVGTILSALISIPVLASGNWPGLLFVSFIWLWLVGGNLAIGVPRFRRFIRHAIETAPQLRDNHSLNTDAPKDGAPVS
jgi:hypothetical protein